MDAHSAFGVVFKGKYNGGDVAIKKSKLQGENDYFLISSWADEVRKLGKLNDQNIARFLGVCEEKGNWALVQEWVDGHDLREVMKSYPGGAPNDLLGRIGQQIAEGLSYLHVNNILHLNVSPGNIIFNSSRSTLKLRDYGLRTFKLANFAKNNYHGNPRYVACEVMMRQHDNISTASDVWSWGFVMWEAGSGETVFSGYNPPQISRKIWEAGDRPDLEDVKNKDLARLIAQCWSKNSSSRPPVSQLISTSQDISRAGGAVPSAEKKPGLFQPQGYADEKGEAPSAKTDAALDDMLNDLDKML